MEHSADPHSVAISHDGLVPEHHHSIHHSLHHHHPHLPHATGIHTHHVLQDPLPTVEVDPTGTGATHLPLPPSLLYYATTAVVTNPDSGGNGGPGGSPGTSTVSTVVGDGVGDAAVATAGNHLVGTAVTRKRGRPRKPPTPYNCAFVGCLKQITKRRFCAAHQKRRERARKKAQQQQAQQAAQPDVGAGITGVGEDQQALLANLPPLPPMLQEGVASAQPLMLPFQLQMMAELNKQAAYEEGQQSSYEGQHHVAQQSYEPQPGYEIAQQAYEQAHVSSQAYHQQEETYEEVSYETRKRKREDEETDTSPETIVSQPGEEHLPAHPHDSQLNQNEPHDSSALQPEGGGEQHTQERQHQEQDHHHHHHRQEDGEGEDWNANTLVVVGQEGSLSGDHHHHHHELEHEHEHGEHAHHPMDFPVEVLEEESVHLTTQQQQQPNESKSNNLEAGEPEVQETAWS